MSEQVWPDVSLGELFTINTDGVAPYVAPNAEFHHHSLPAWDEFGGPTVEKGAYIESNKTRIKKPCVLVSKLNPRKPRVSVVEAVPEEERHCASTEFVCLEPKSEEPLNFWGHLLSNKSFSENLDRIAIGSTNSHKRYSPKALLSQRIELPPEPERRLMARILDTLDTQIQKTETLIAKLEKVKEGLLHDLLTRGIDENDQLRPSPEQAPELYKDSPLGLIPREWDIVTVGEVGDIVTGSTPPSSARSAWGGPHLFFTPSDVNSYGLLSRTERTLSDDGLKYLRIVPPNTTLVVCIGSIGKVGITACEGGTNQQINSVIPKPELDSYFVYLAIRKHVNQIDAWAGLQVVPIVNKTTFSRMMVPRPSFNEQGVISDSMRILEARLSHERSTGDKLREKKAGLMDDLLTGRVRVTPLLERAEAGTPA